MDQETIHTHTHFSFLLSVARSARPPKVCDRDTFNFFHFFFRWGVGTGWRLETTRTPHHGTDQLVVPLL